MEFTLANTDGNAVGDGFFTKTPHERLWRYLRGPNGLRSRFSVRSNLDIVGWLVDDVSVFATDTGFVNGTYSIAPIAFEERGAVDVGVTTTLTVANCS